MDHKERTRRVAAAAALISIVTSVAYSEPRLSDPTSEVYYNYAAVAGALVQVEKDAEIVGDLYSNGDVQLKMASTVDGDVSAAGVVESRGTVSGTVTEGAPALKLPAILDEAAWRALADRVFEDDELVLTDEVIDDVVFVAGTVHLRGRISGTGTVIAGGDVRLDSTGGGPPPLPDPSSRLSFVASKDIRIGKDRAFRGVLRAGHDVQLEMGADFEGVAVADNLVQVKQGARMRFFDFDETAPTVELVEPPDGGTVDTATPRIELAFADDFSGVRASSTVFLLDGADRTAEAAVTAEGLVFTPAEALAEGLHTIEVTVFDHSDNQGGGSFSFTVATVPPIEDDEPPFIAVISPAAGTVPSGSDFDVAVRYSDEVSGLDLTTFEARLDGAVLTGCTVGPASALCPVSGLADGAHTVVATVADRARNESSSTLAFNVEPLADEVAPVLEIASPDGRPVVLGTAVEIQAGYSDAESGIDLGSLTIEVDGVEVTGGCELTSLFARCAAGELALGAHTVSAAVEDVAGNLSMDSVAFVVEDPASLPNLAITAPGPAGTFDSSPEITVEYGATDRALDPASLGVEVDGVSVVASCTVEAAFARCESELLAPGGHTVAATIADVEGLAAEASVDFEVLADGEPPVIVLESPVDGGATDVADLEVRGTVTDDNAVASLSVNDLSVAVAGDGTFSTTVTLIDGLNLVRLEATDPSGNVGRASASVRFPIDDRPPQVEITSLDEGSFVGQARPAIDFVFTDDNEVDPASLEVSADGAVLDVVCELTAVSGSCTPAVDLPEGARSLSVSLADVIGNRGSDAVSFTVDTLGVEVELTGPADGLITRDAQVLVTGIVGPGVTAVTVDGVEAALSGSGFSATVDLEEGRNMVVALATKANGNTGSAMVEITRDLQPPIVRINSPADGFVSVDDKVAITGIVNDIVDGGISSVVTVAGIEVPVAARGFMLADLELVPGPNVIRAEAVDAAGNQGAHEITVFFDPPVGPRIGIVSGNGQVGRVRDALPEPLVAVVTDDLGNPVAGRVVRFEVSRNSGLLRAAIGDEPSRAVQVPTDGAGRAQAFFTLGDTTGEGSNRVKATGIGVAGEVEFCASTLPAPPARVLMTGGDNQRGATGQALPLPFEALVVDPNGNPIPGVEVTFEVVEGDGGFETGPSIVRQTGNDGVARAVLKLGASPGVNNHVVRATASGVFALPATFVASAMAPGDPADTRLSGVVLDNAQDPIPNALVAIVGTSVFTRTDEEGAFTLTGVPVGSVHLLVEPSESPRPQTFPPLAFDTVTVAGHDNTIGQPILIPAIDVEGAAVVGGDEDVTLTMEGVEGLQLTVFANSATFPDGSDTGVLSISQVHLDKVPMAPPSGTFFMPPAWTIQPAGVVFDPPARITIPNDGLAPGRVIDIFQFDHSINTFVNVGKGTVSDDGFLIVSDPGFGITRTGWGGCGQPPPPDTCVDGCPKCQKCENGSCVPDDGGDPGGSCKSISAGGEASTLQGLAQSALNRLPFVDEVMVEGEFSAEACPLCCNGSVLQLGEVTGSGSFTASAEVEKFLSPVDVEKEIEFSIFGFGIEFELEFKLGPFIKFGPSLTLSGELMRNNCTGENCLTARACAGYGIQVGGGAKFEFEVDTENTDDLIEIEVRALAFGQGTGDVGVNFSSCDDLFDVTGCIDRITGNIDIEIFFFTFSVEKEFFGGFGTCCEG